MASLGTSSTHCHCFPRKECFYKESLFPFFPKTSLQGGQFTVFAQFTGKKKLRTGKRKRKSFYFTQQLLSDLKFFSLDLLEVLLWRKSSLLLGGGDSLSIPHWEDFAFILTSVVCAPKSFIIYTHTTESFTSLSITKTTSTELDVETNFGQPTRCHACLSV